MKKPYFIERIIQKYPDNFKIYNYDLLPEVFTLKDEIPIECYEHGIFYQTPLKHILGKNGCPLCSSGSVENSFIVQFKTKFGEMFEYFDTNIKTRDSRLTIKCSKHGNFVSSPRLHLRLKTGCPKCEFERKLSFQKDYFLKKAIQVHNNKYDYSKVVFVGKSKKVEIVCVDHGSFYQDLYDHAIKAAGCPVCSVNNGKLKVSEFITRSNLIHNFKYCYSKVNYFTLQDKIEIICKKHGPWFQRANSHLSGNGCLKCHKESVTNSTEEFVKNAKIVHGEKYDYSKVDYKNNKTKVEILCRKHGSFYIKPNSHIANKTGCRWCCESRGEIEVKKVLEKYNFNFVREHRVEGYKYRYDFFLPEFNIFIEFHGQQHYYPVEAFGGESAFQRTRYNDKHKVEIVKCLRGYLIVIPYTHSGSEQIESALISGFKRAYRYWFCKNGKIEAFKTRFDIIKKYNLPEHTTEKDLIEKLSCFGDFKICF